LFQPARRRAQTREVDRKAPGVEAVEVFLRGPVVRQQVPQAVMRREVSEQEVPRRVAHRPVLREAVRQVGVRTQVVRLEAAGVGVVGVQREVPVPG